MRETPYIIVWEVERKNDESEESGFKLNAEAYFYLPKIRQNQEFKIEAPQTIGLATSDLKGWDLEERTTVMREMYHDLRNKYETFIKDLMQIQGEIDFNIKHQISGKSIRSWPSGTPQRDETMKARDYLLGGIEKLIQEERETKTQYNTKR